MDSTLPSLPVPEVASIPAEYSLYVFAAYALAALLMLALALTGHRRRAKARARLERTK